MPNEAYLEVSTAAFLSLRVPTLPWFSGTAALASQLTSAHTNSATSWWTAFNSGRGPHDG
eukprot:CAMPEP_0204307824 /NCGR_PEP_ID=MMETSP0469-20131031/145_1 /ASSEMBLY_ACC=CAM_ASM_000384 /TAXON_ID=2969 /ORGANISM="Oxyrrhis marina" /LENGTH=59 /DNA_ID=CAMNT_0051287217 /DNA_START=184 /DNA_END=359 /DNA_ORIENTATION=+